MTGCASDCANMVYEPYAYQIVSVSRNLSPFWGKNEMKMLENIPRYKIIDYDYDKSNYLEFETITYEKCEDLGEVTSDVYLPGQHVLASINRNLILFGLGLRKYLCL